MQCGRLGWRLLCEVRTLVSGGVSHTSLFRAVTEHKSSECTRSQGGMYVGHRAVHGGGGVLKRVVDVR